MTYLYSRDGLKKVNIETATLLGDVNRDLDICRQGDRTQLWRSINGSYFTGSCLEFALGCKNTKSFHIFPISNEAARAWVIEYYGPEFLEKFGMANDATEI